MNLHVGTSGYSYKEWKGPFYPEKIAPAEMLAYYGGQLPAVEINNTFYRLPRKSVLDNWAEQVPESFRFSIKASRRITHFKRLKNAEDETGYLLETTATLGDRLGVILFQLPPNFGKELERLEGFLDFLPTDIRAAFEFRNDSWFDDEVYAALRAHGAALVVSDTNDADAEIVATAPFGYLRLRKDSYPDKDVSAWADKILAQDWEDVFVFFKHEDEGAGPKMAKQFLEVAEG